jgi:hypothetical protein
VRLYPSLEHKGSGRRRPGRPFDGSFLHAVREPGRPGGSSERVLETRIPDETLRRRFHVDGRDRAELIRSTDVPSSLSNQRPSTARLPREESPFVLEAMSASFAASSSRPPAGALAGPRRPGVSSAEAEPRSRETPPPPALSASSAASPSLTRASRSRWVSSALRSLLSFNPRG